MKERMLEIQNWIDQYPWLEMLSSLIILIAVAIIFYLITKKIVVVGLRKVISKLPITNNDIFANHSVIRRIANVVPAIVILNGINTVPHLPEKLIQLTQMTAQAWIFLTIALSISELLNIFNLAYQRNPKSHNKPIKGYLQLIKLIIFIVCGLMILGTFLKKDVFTLLAGFGAMAAVLMLVFQNTILSLVASVQISSYDMIRVGDWIEMPSLGADGTVIDMSLHTVTVQNFDKTYTTIPTNRLVTDTFKNWRGMSDSGCRRIKRSLNIDQGSVRFLTTEEIENLKHSAILNDYLEKKATELNEWNTAYTAEVNQRHLTNVGTFRVYVEQYLHQHAGIAQNQSILVRQLQPTSEGLPLEIWAFTNTTNWGQYEEIQSSIFEHLYAIMGKFGLSAYQTPSSLDYRVCINNDAPQHLKLPG